MAKPTVLEIDCSTGEQVSREMTDAEFADYQAGQVAAKAQADQQAAADAEQAAKVAAVNAKLAAIGLTQDDLVTLGMALKNL